jgi:hypothetical protein
VSSLVHANKRDEVSREGGFSCIRSVCPEGDEGKPVCKRPSHNPDTEKKSGVVLKNLCTTPSSERGVWV